MAKGTCVRMAALAACGLLASSVTAGAQVRVPDVWDWSQARVAGALGTMRAGGQDVPALQGRPVSCGDSCGGADPAVFLKLLGVQSDKTCWHEESDDMVGRPCGRTVTKEGAMEVAQRAAQGRVDADTFLAVFKRTDDYNLALQAAEGQQGGTLSAEAFLKLLDLQSDKTCWHEESDDMVARPCGKTVTKEGAMKVAQLAAQGRVDVDTFVAVFKRSDDFDAALKLARR